MSKPKTAGQLKIDIPSEVLYQLLTASEIQMLKNRWQIIQALEDGLSIRAVAKQIKVGTDTVVRVARMVEKGDLRKTVEKIKIKKVPFKTSTPWIFGKSD